MSVDMVELFQVTEFGIQLRSAKFQEGVSKSWFKAQNDCVTSNGGICSSFSQQMLSQIEGRRTGNLGVEKGTRKVSSCGMGYYTLITSFDCIFQLKRKMTTDPGKAP